MITLSPMLLSNDQSGFVNDFRPDEAGHLSALVLPGHNLPFVGFSTRADELIAHHEARCFAILEACRVGPQTVADLVPVIFGRKIDDPHSSSSPSARRSRT